MRENEALEHHATFVMTTLDEAISNIDNYNYVIDHLHRTGATHQRFIDFSSENFGKIKEPFLEAVKITLGDRYTDYMANVYTKTIDFILSALSHGYLDKNQCYELQSTKSPVTSSDQQSTKSPGKTNNLIKLTEFRRQTKAAFQKSKIAQNRSKKKK